MGEGTLGIVIAAVILVLGGVGVWMVGRASRPDEDDAPPRPDPQPEPQPEPEPAPPVVEEPTPAPPPVEEPAPEPVDPPTGPPAPEPDPEPEGPGADPEPVPPDPAPDPEPEPEEPAITFPPDPMRQPFIEPGLTAGHLYVDPVEGNDRNDGRTPEKAVRTIHEAIQKAAAGNVILVRRGTLTPTSRHVISKPLTIMGYGTERPRIDASGLGRGSNARVFTPNVPGVHVKGFEVFEARGDGGIVNVSTPGITVEDMHIHDSSMAAVYFYGPDAGGKVIDVAAWKLGDGSTQHTNVPDCIVATGGAHDIEIIRPVLFNGPDDGLDLFHAKNVLIRDFVVVGGGYYWNGNPGGGSLGDGNGLKLGGSRPSGNNRAIGGLALGNRAVGVGHNQATEGGVVMDRITSIRNGYLDFDVGKSRGNVVRGSVNERGVERVYVGAPARSEGNSWESGRYPIFRDAEGGDFRLTNMEGVGATDDALEVAHYWLNQGIPYFVGNA